MAEAAGRIDEICAVCDEIVIELAEENSSAGKGLMKSFPLLDAIYEVPVYNVRVYLATNHLKRSAYSNQRNFLGLRFGPYKNDGSDPRYKSKGEFVSGLAEDKWYRCTRCIADYELHSTDSAENGAWVITGTFYIHDGPDNGTFDQIFGTAGCVEMYGPDAFSNFSDTVKSFAGAAARTEAPRKKKVWIHVIGARRPVLKKVFTINPVTNSWEAMP